ncbi:9-cis-epoxycarotenoid dioxygenase NCED3, chloroplastic-like [Camellia sinensis]|uniref:9-cis-epoxycarotenoid dioxygenase NCED3, chloroplastic-like n=1 Tax=Camellia sinensis TaxID=4442 RepID=UPI001036799F|nr:9-cis-epoxycarotenoid dioxygenase NCED3, chloroplastic-like [Camellia sinensis]
MATLCLASQVKGSIHKQPIPHRIGELKTSLSSTVKPFIQELEKLPMRIDVSKTIKSVTLRILDAFVDSVFQFVDQPVLPSQRNFVPVEEIGHIAQIEGIVGEIPADFPEGVYIRNGANPLWGGLKSTISVFGKSSHVWVEGEGMLHALYFSKDTNGNWSFAYNNRFVEPKTFKMEKQRNKPSYLPAVEGDSPAILAAFVLNALRFGDVNKILSNTSVFEHGGKYYSIAENYLAQEIDISSLSTLDDWDLGGAWGRPFTTHPKKAPGSGELVIMGVDAVKPYYVVGVISADGKKLIHKADVKLKRSTLAHEIGITQNQPPIDLCLLNVIELCLSHPRYLGYLVSPICDVFAFKGHFGNPIKMEHHKFAKNNFCTGSAYVSKPGGSEEDDGWIVAYVHDEDTDTSHVIVVDAKNFQGEPIAKIPLPQRVPYGHHGAYFQTPSQH